MVIMMMIIMMMTTMMKKNYAVNIKTMLYMMIFSTPVQTGPGAHPASYTKRTGSYPGVKRPGCGVDHSPHLAPRLKKQ
jgi:hypothetical protein